jgi:hypothetical protein
MVGSGSQLGRKYSVRVYRLYVPVTLEKLLDFIPDSNGGQQRILGLMRKRWPSLEEAKEKYSDWYERRIAENIGRLSATCTIGGCIGSGTRSGWGIVFLELRPLRFTKKVWDQRGISDLAVQKKSTVEDTEFL